MKFTKFSNEMVAELLTHLADNETFSTIRGLEGVSKSDVQETLIEIAHFVKESGEDHPIMHRSQIKRQHLSNKTSEVISSLSPNEEGKLLKSFKISE